MRFDRGRKPKAQIPTTTMGDIVFLLLLFFMVSSVIRTEEGLPVNLPRAQSGIESRRTLVTHVWIDRLGRIAIDDRIVTPDQVFDIVARKCRANPQLIVALQADARARYGVVDAVMQALRRANALRMQFGNRVEPPQRELRATR
jgi:biopolymer transport protein ExbD